MIQQALPRLVQLERVPLRVALITGAASYGLGMGAFLQGYPLWAIGLVALLPWIPLFGFEAIWKYEHYGFYAIFGVLTALQIGHFGEHIVQMLQLLATHGNVKLSRGVFGQLDIEAVHFVWNVIVWLGTCLLLYVFGFRNRWLVVSFVAASLHMLEHFYLYWIYLTDHPFYLAGGANGIMGLGGMIGSPLVRPYLHFVYNYFEVIPLALAFWDQTKTVYDQYLAKALPRLTPAELIATTVHLERVTVQPGEVIVREGDVADRFYIISRGEVEVVQRAAAGEKRLVVLGPGRFFGEIGLLAGARRTATVRATRAGELLALDREAFERLVASSTGGRADLDVAVRERLGVPQEVG